MAHDKRNGHEDVSGNRTDTSNERVDGWYPNYMTLRGQAIDYPPELTSPPPPPPLPDLRMRNLNFSCPTCGEVLRALTEITKAQEDEIERRWNKYHSHTNGG